MIHIKTANGDKTFHINPENIELVLEEGDRVIVHLVSGLKLEFNEIDIKQMLFDIFSMQVFKLQELDGDDIAEILDAYIESLEEV